MKIGGIEVSKLEDLIVLPRPNGADIPFRAKSVAINEEFDKMVPEPVPPLLQTKEGKVQDRADASYLEARALRESQRFAYMCIKSLDPSEIEWELVDLNKPSSWPRWQEDLMSAGISEVECNRVVGLVMGANALDERKIEAARQSFLHGQGE